MARRKSRKSRPSRRRTSGLNVVNAAQTYLQTAIVTQAAFRTTPIEFVTGVTSVNRTKKASPNLTYTITENLVGYQPALDGSMITLPELLGIDSTGKDGVAVPFGGLNTMANIRSNIIANGGYAKPIVQTILLNGGFAIGRKVFSRQRSLLNKAAKMSGLNSMVRF